MSDNKAKGIWIETINETTGESSIKEHKPKVVWRSCKQGEHQFKIVNNRELECVKCGVIRTFVPGRDNKFLKDNKIN